MKRNHKVVAAAFGLAAVFALSACSTSGPADSSKANITFLTFETPALTAKFWDTSIANAEKEVPGISVKKIVTPGADRNAYAKQLQASGQFPDVLSSIDPKDFTDAGLLKPFDQTWLDDNFILPKGNEIAGKTYIPPTNSQIIPMIFYNKDIFKAHGLSVPTTWDEFMNVVKTLHAAGVTPLEMAGGEPWSASIPLTGIISADVLGADPNWIQERYAGSVKFTDADMTAAFQKYRDLISAGGFDKGALGVNYADANTQFLAGKAAMYPMGSWLIGQIKPADARQVRHLPAPQRDRQHHRAVQHRRDDRGQREIEERGQIGRLRQSLVAVDGQPEDAHRDGWRLPDVQEDPVREVRRHRHPRVHRRVQVRDRDEQQGQLVRLGRQQRRTAARSRRRLQRPLAEDVHRR